MKVSEFLESIEQEGVLLHTRRILDKAEVYYVVRLKNASLIQRYIIIYEDCVRIRRAMTINSFHKTLDEAVNYLDEGKQNLRLKIR